MCGRFSLFVPQSDLENRFDAEAIEPIEPRYNIAPMDEINVIANDDHDHFDRHQWGFQPQWWDESQSRRPPINARAETLAEKPMWKEAFAERRCLIPADGFYEWQGESGSKRPFRVRRNDGEPFAFAGIWTTWGANGDEIDTCAIITTKPNDVIEPIHDRMPVMLEPDEEEQWLEADPDEAEQILNPYTDELTEAYEISTAVNNPENDSPEIIEPIGHDQSGLGQFG